MPIPPTSRRGFLATAAGAAAVCSGCALFQRRDEDIALEDADVIELSLADHPALREPNGYLRAEVDARDLRLIIINRGDEGLLAIDMTCTHMGCDVDWMPDARELECSCHGSRFAPTGEVLEGPADEPLARYPITIDGDRVSVDVTRTVVRGPSARAGGRS